MHRKGIHCGSTAMADALRVQGLDLPEEQVFGLGSGLGFSLHDGDTGLAPPQAARFFVGRSASFERDLCEALGAELIETHYARAADAPLAQHDLLFTNLKELPYLDAHGHWFGHLVMVARTEPLLLWDNERDDPQPVTRAQLDKAMGEAAPVQRGTGVTILRVASAPRAVPDEAARNAILRNALQMTEQAAAGEGVEGIDQLADELPKWREAADWPRRARLAAQVIETRGCGGGLFRRLHARFLQREAPELAPLCEAAADAWTGLAHRLDKPAAQACAAAERALWGKALRVCQ